MPIQETDENTGADPANLPAHEPAARLNETTYRELLDLAPDGIVVIDASGQMLLANVQAHRLFGYPAGTLVGQSVDVLLPEAMRGAHAGHRAGYMASPRPRPMGAGLDLIGLRRDGSEFAVEISLSPIQTGTSPLVMAAIRDISDRKRAETQIKGLNENLARRLAELDAANRELEAFSYSVSHDLRAPLRALDGFSQALVEDFGDSLAPEAHDHLRRIRAAAVRMGRLIDDLLALAGVTRREMHRETVDLTALARTVAEQLRRAESERGVDFVIAEGLRASGDSHLLQVVLQNLLGNAWKFTGQQGYARIEFGATTEGGECVYHVRDNGVGFDMAYADKLFGAFQRLHAAQDFAGTGIGLATVQRVILRHGGRVWAYAEPGKGATFHFTLGEAA
jgi:PAS domain S-box-containing protein